MVFDRSYASNEECWFRIKVYCKHGNSLLATSFLSLLRILFNIPWILGVEVLPGCVPSAKNARKYFALVFDSPVLPVTTGFPVMVFPNMKMVNVAAVVSLDLQLNIHYALRYKRMTFITLIQWTFFTWAGTPRGLAQDYISRARGWLCRVRAWNSVCYLGAGWLITGKIIWFYVYHVKCI